MSKLHYFFSFIFFFNLNLGVAKQLEVINLELVGSAYLQTKFVKFDKGELKIINPDENVTLNIKSDPVKHKEVAKNALKFINKDLVIVRSNYFYLFTNDIKSSFIVLGSLDHSIYNSACTTEVKLLSRINNEKKSSIIVSDSMPEINYISQNKYPEMYIEESSQKKLSALLENKVDLISVLSFENDGVPRLEPLYMDALKQKKIKIADSTQNKIPCFLLILNRNKQELAPKIIKSLIAHQNTSKTAKADFMKIGKFDIFTPMKNWPEIREKIFKDNLYLKYKYNEVNLNLKKIQ